MLEIGSVEIDPTMPEAAEDELVISVSEFSNNAPSPLPKADRFFVLGLIADSYFFVFVSNMPHVIVL